MAAGRRRHTNYNRQTIFSSVLLCVVYRLSVCVCVINIRYLLSWIKKKFHICRVKVIFHIFSLRGVFSLAVCVWWTKKQNLLKKEKFHLIKIKIVKCEL